jgi:CO/xanthine dehydrogenase Mo-binding subunit
MPGLRVVGTNVVKIDALDKATGRTKFCSEEGIGVPGLLHAKVLWSPHAQARIVGIDTSDALKVKGVKAVATGKDTPPHRSGLFVADRHVLCHERVRFVGDAVACVAATTPEIAEEAAGLIKVDYEVLPAVFDPEEAMAPDCRTVVHPGLPQYVRAVHPYLAADLPGPNVHTHHRVRKGDVEAAFAAADFVLESRYVTDRMTHCQLEPYNSVCYPDAGGSLTLWTSARLTETMEPICQAFDLGPSRLRVRAGYLGGMFGILGRPERFTTLMAMMTGRPVKMVYSREEVFVDGLNRLSMTIYVRDGLRKDGTILARELKVVANTGAYAAHGPLIIRNGSYHASQYRLPNYKWDAYGVYTNQPPCGPLRGFGSAEVLWATECQMDVDAEKVGLDPLEFRLRNTVDEGETDVRGNRVRSIGAKRCLEKVGKAIDLAHPSPQPAEPHTRVGKGIALGNKYTAADTASSAAVVVRMDGTIEVIHGGDDCGQGLNTVLAQIAAEEFSVPIEQIKIVWGDSARTPYDFGTASSRSTLYIGNAVLKACEDAKAQIRRLAADRVGTSPENIGIADGGFFLLDDPAARYPISQLALRNNPGARDAIKGATCLDESAEIRGSGVFWGRPAPEDPQTGQGTRSTMSYAYGAQAAEVAVDTETGQVTVLRLYSAFDNGKTMHPKMCEGQIEGGAAMGIGAALTEGFKFDESGRLMNPNYHDYKTPSIADVPTGDDTAVFFEEAPHDEGPYGAKGVGESAMCPTASAIANAVYAAVGVRLTHIPMTPDRVLAALKESGRASSR